MIITIFCCRLSNYCLLLSSILLELVTIVIIICLNLRLIHQAATVVVIIFVCAGLALTIITIAVIFFMIIEIIADSTSTSTSQTIRYVYFPNALCVYARERERENTDATTITSTQNECTQPVACCRRRCRRQLQCRRKSVAPAEVRWWPLRALRAVNGNSRLGCAPDAHLARLAVPSVGQVHVPPFRAHTSWAPNRGLHNAEHGGAAKQALQILASAASNTRSLDMDLRRVCKLKPNWQLNRAQIQLVHSFRAANTFISMAFWFPTIYC